MTTDQAKTLSENAINRLIEAIEQGHSEALKTYLSAMSRFHRYSWGNCLLIQSQKPEATRVAGFHGWLRLRRFVRKGEKGIVILAPMIGRKRTENVPEEDASTRVFGFRAAYVFDVSQTDGDGLPEFTRVNGEPKDYMDRLVQFVESRQIALDYSEAIAPARGMSCGGKITLLPSMDSAETFAVLVHEVAHELLHKAERRAQTTHTIRETEAEAVAFVVCSAIGLDTNSACSDYIQLHAGDKATLIESLALIQDTASTILQRIQPEAEAVL